MQTIVMPRSSGSLLLYRPYLNAFEKFMLWTLFVVFALDLLKYIRDCNNTQLLTTTQLQFY